MAFRAVRNLWGCTAVAAIAAAASWLPTVHADSAAAPADSAYQEQIKPILAKNCTGCHILGGHSGGLKLDTLPDILHGGNDGPVVNFGNASSSMLSQAIHYQDETLQMPPKAKLSDADIAVIDKWIQESAAPLASPADTPAPTVSAVAPVAVPTPATASVPLASAPSAPAPSVAVPPVAASVVSVSSTTLSPQMTDEQRVFFETKVRPVLVNSCYPCHASSAKGGLRLDSRDGILAGGKDGQIVVPGHPELSVMSSAVHYVDLKLQMPPRNSLPADKIAAIDQWIKDGMPWPQETPVEVTSKITDAQKNFWSFKAPVAPAVPAVKSAWVHNDIDRFTLAKMQEMHLTPVADANKHDLLRRVTYDLTGLPPTPAEVIAFDKDKSPQAYERVVDRLLASSAYGERWGRIWLDVVRYADTSGDAADYPIVQVSKYRDYVIAAFNKDKPYDQFIKEQIAGDLLPAATEPEHWEHVVATGYIANASRLDGTQVQDTVDNIGFAYLGMTVACARCHDHKFDPIPTSDYYAMAGVFQSTHYPNPGTSNPRMQVGFVYRDPKAAEAPAVKSFYAQLKPIQNAIDAVSSLPGTYDDVLPQLEARRMDLFAHAPVFPETAYAVSDAPVHLAQIQKHGDPAQLGDEVPRGFLQALGNSTMDPNEKGSGRLELANWIASPNNPLTARVMVNRIWQGEFGHGIVATPNNFGKRGVPPSDQALLDYLATQFIAKGWSIKAMQREILLSHTYQISTTDNAINEGIDPDNNYMWRHSRMRLDAEEIRDSMLAESGQLDRTPAGPHPFPPPSKWNWEEQNPFAPNFADYENNHRTVYMMVQRTVRHPYMTLFDGANPQTSTEQRTSSLTPLQALYFLNSPFPATCADDLSNDIQKDPNQKAAVDSAFLTIFGRHATADEQRQTSEFLEKVSTYYTAHGDAPAAAKQKAMSNFLQAMFASNEFMFIE
jgi:mono/diheme cytochrome c family protein